MNDSKGDSLFTSKRLSCEILLSENKRKETIFEESKNFWENRLVHSNGYHELSHTFRYLSRCLRKAFLNDEMEGMKWTETENPSVTHQAERKIHERHLRSAPAWFSHPLSPAFSDTLQEMQ